MSRRCIKNYIMPGNALRQYLISYALLEKSLNSANLSQTSGANRWERVSFFWAKCHAIFSIKLQLICKCVSSRISVRLFPALLPFYFFPLTNTIHACLVFGHVCDICTCRRFVATIELRRCALNHCRAEATPINVASLIIICVNLSFNSTWGELLPSIPLRLVLSRCQIQFSCPDLQMASNNVIDVRYIPEMRQRRKDCVI